MQLSVLRMATLVIVVATSPAAVAGDAGREFFERKVRPILVERCYRCHSAAAKKVRGGLLLDSRESLLKGGDSGPALEAGKPDDSLLIAAVRHGDGVEPMPPKEKLPEAVIGDLVEWVRMGAPDPRDRATPIPAAAGWAEALRTRRTWWSLQAVRPVAVPAPQNGGWSEHPIDRYLLAAMENRGLTPGDLADPVTIARRLTLVLTGLPPDPRRIAEFVAQCRQEPGRPAAVARLVDELLSSPHFGERWARHWMDVVRFTETHGNEWNYEVHHAWRYRDYLIRAFNDDVPYDQFVREHIAGDLLAQTRWNSRDGFNESVIGTAFYRFGEANHDDCIGIREIGYDLADNQIDTLTKAFQATTVACARCHDHKLDAVSTQDYYGLLGIIRSSRMVSQTIDAPEVNSAIIERLRGLKRELRTEIAAGWAKDVRQTARYLQAAAARLANRGDAADFARGLAEPRLAAWVAALSVVKSPLEDVLEPWRRASVAAGRGPAALADSWGKLREEFTVQDQERREFNRARFADFADFRRGSWGGWDVGGQGLRDLETRSGDFVVQADGDRLLAALLPAGCFTNRLSARLNGTLRSPVLPSGKKFISFQVLGQRSSAVRLVSNNCQLNYANYRALTSDQFQWVTFTIPDDRESLRTYAELMTMFDNPKFPDQLSALGGDRVDYKVPWEKAAADPRSWFGVTRVVCHDGPEPPRPELSHLSPLFAGSGPKTLAELATRYEATIGEALSAWTDDHATDNDVQWLNALLGRELLDNRIAQWPRALTLVREYRRLDGQLSLPRVVPGVADAGLGYDQPILVRGDCRRPGVAVARGYLEALSTWRSTSTSSPAPTATGSGRLELAEQIASMQNPLTARVMVNRVWHHLFGAGLVRTVDDFGHVGELPSHPELLDYLAARFVADGWSVKRLMRAIVLSRAFQLTGRTSAAAREIDPQNRLLSHYPARRMEAEVIRDAILATSGRLDQTFYGMSVYPYRDKAVPDRRLFPGPIDGDGRRTIYIKNNLMEPPRFLGAFNLPGGKTAQGRRDVTNVPAQALALLNDALVLQQADVWAQHLQEQPDDSVAARIIAMFRTALGRAPTDPDLRRFEQATMRLAELHGVPPLDVLRSRVVWKDVAHATFNLEEFLYIP